MERLDLLAAREQDVEPVFSLYEKRVGWMDEAGVDQWNRTDYLHAYHIAYYRRQQALGNLYVMRDGGARVLGAVVLLQEDPRWSGQPACAAYYVHNLVTDPAVRGVGAQLLLQAEALALRQGKACVRLDCAEDNAFLNAYYEARGYRTVGTCRDGLYRGRLREKRLEGLL